MKSSPKQLYEKRCEKEYQIHRGKMEEFEESLKEEQEKCKHKKTQFYPDASGNNDSYYECINCGKHV